MKINTIPTVVCFEKIVSLAILSTDNQFSNGKEWLELLDILLLLYYAVNYQISNENISLSYYSIVYHI
jgi:hypothetical protein